MSFRLARLGRDHPIIRFQSLDWVECLSDDNGRPLAWLHSPFQSLDWVECLSDTTVSTAMGHSDPAMFQSLDWVECLSDIPFQCLQLASGGFNPSTGLSVFQTRAVWVTSTGPMGFQSLDWVECLSDLPS